MKITVYLGANEGIVFRTSGNFSKVIFILMANMPWLEQRAIAMKEKIRLNILKSCAAGKSSACGFLWRWRKRQDTRNLPG